MVFERRCLPVYSALFGLVTFQKIIPTQRGHPSGVHSRTHPRLAITTSNHAIILLKSDGGLALNLMLIMVNLTMVLKSLDTMCMLIVSTIPLTILTPRRVCNIYSCSNWNCIGALIGGVAGGGYGYNKAVKRNIPKGQRWRYVVGYGLVGAVIDGVIKISDAWVKTR